MPRFPRQLHLVAALRAPGQHELGRFVDLARTAERGLLDAVFLDDSLAGRAEGPTESGLEPVTLLSALATATERLGLIATASTTFHEPYLLARTFASLDHISHGRAGWNIATGGALDEGENFHLDEPVERAVGYERAAELLDVVTQLWDSWADDAVRSREIEHTGLFFKVRGPLNVRRPPQGWPLLVQQADSSAEDVEFAARYAEVVFTRQHHLDAAVDFALEVKTRAAGYGREANTPLVLPEIEMAGAGAERTAGLMQVWAEAGAADGFVVLSSAGTLNAFVNQVVPLLQQRGLFRTDYGSGTLRDRFALPRPEDHFPSSVPTVQAPVAWPALSPV